MGWVYYQSSGRLELDGRLVGTGYSGAPGYINDPNEEDKKDRGPVPRGRYSIGSPRYSTTTGPYALPLTPIDHSAHGRNHFQIHGDSRRHPGTASSGCVILPREVREIIGSSGSSILEVRRSHAFSLYFGNDCGDL